MHDDVMLNGVFRIVISLLPGKDTKPIDRFMNRAN